MKTQEDEVKECQMSKCEHVQTAQITSDEKKARRVQHRSQMRSRSYYAPLRDDESLICALGVALQGEMRRINPNNGGKAVESRGKLGILDNSHILTGTSSVSSFGTKWSKSSLFS